LYQVPWTDQPASSGLFRPLSGTRIAESIGLPEVPRWRRGGSLSIIHSAHEMEGAPGLDFSCRKRGFAIHPVGIFLRKSVLFQRMRAITYQLEDKLNELAQYLIENLMFDIKGEVTSEVVRAFLRKDDSPEARALLQKIIEEKGIDELLDTLVECLTQDIARLVDTQTVKGHLANYSEA